MKKFALILLVTMLFGCHHHYKHKNKKPIKQQVKQEKPTLQPIQEIEVNLQLVSIGPSCFLVYLPQLG